MRRTRKVIPKPDALSEIIDTFGAYAPKCYFSSGDFCRDIRLLYHWLDRADVAKPVSGLAQQGKARQSIVNGDTFALPTRIAMKIVVMFSVQSSCHYSTV